MPAKFYQIDLLLIPKLGFYANLTAQIVSQISSHFIIYYTRKVVREAKKHLHDEGRSAVQNSNEDIASNEVLSDRTTSESTAFQAEESLARHGYTRVHRGEKDSLVPRSFVNLMLCGVACVLTVFVVLGCSMPSFTAEMFGIFGLIVEAGSGFENDAKNDISLFRMIKILFEQAEFRDRVGGYIGLSTLSALLIATVLVVPLLQSAMLLYQWFLPMTKSKRKRVIVILEVLQAWQYTEVFALSVVAGSWQLGSVSHFMVNIYCDYLSELRNLFAQLVHFDLLPEEDAQCFLVEASVSSGFFLMAAGAILLALLNTFVTNATKQYLMELPSATIVPAPPKMDVRDNIEPSPVLFTDRFRWLLGREDRGFSRSDQNGETEKDVAVFDDSMDFQAAPAATRLSCSSSDVDEGPQSPTHGPVKAIDLDA